MKIRALAIVALLTLPLLAAACGGSDDTNSGDRPSASELTDGFAAQIPEGTPGREVILECYGREFEASDLPNGVLRSLAAGEEEQQIDADNEEKYTAIIDEIIQTCTDEAVASVTGGDLTTTTAAG